MPSNIKFYGPTNQFYILKRMMRYGMALTSAEFKVYCFIYDRTFSWSKDVESIPYTHFIDGVVGSDGRRWAFGVGMAEKALQRAIKGLCDKGAIRRARPGNPWLGTCYWHNLEWEAPGIEKLPLPEKLQPDAAEILARRWQIK